MSSRCLLRLVTVLLLVGVYATGPMIFAAPPPTGGKEAVTIRFGVFALRPIKSLGFVPAPNAAPQPLEFYPTARSPEYVAVVTGPLTFVDSETGRVVAEVGFPPNLTKALLVFVPNRPGRGAGFEVLVIDDAQGASGVGQLSILNLSGLELHGALGRRAIRLGAGLQQLGAIRGAEKIELRATHAGREFRAYTDQVAVRGEERALLILFPPFYAGSLEIQGRLLVDEGADSAKNPGASGR